MCRMLTSAQPTEDVIAAHPTRRYSDELQIDPSPVAQVLRESILKEAVRLYLTMPQQQYRDETSTSMSVHDNFIVDNYVIEPRRVADALVSRVSRMADERARLRRSLISSVEVVEAPELRDCTVRAHKAHS